MTERRWLFLIASSALAIILIFLLFRVGRIDVWAMLRQLQSVNRIAFAKLTLLTALHIYLSNQKWRSVDAALRHSSDSAPSRPASFALTSVGVTLGLFLPVQLTTASARTLGTFVHGKALRRGTAGTLFEQSFDVLIAVFLAVASAITRIFRGAATVWLASAAAMTALALLSVGPMIRLVQRLAASYAARAATLHGWSGSVLRKLAELQHSGILSAGLARRLAMLSAIRFVIQVLMAGQAAEAIGVHIPLWHLGAAIPFVLIACVIVVTPGGIGVNELSYATVLNMFGTPLTVGAQWALANRFLVAASCLVVTACAAAILFMRKITASISCGVAEDH